VTSRIGLQRLLTAYQALKDKKYAQAFDMFSELRRDGMYEACTHLGYMYQHGIERPIDENSAVEVYLDGVIHGVERCQVRIASLLYLTKRYSEAADSMKF
jgi:TPR repeat protein